MSNRTTPKNAHATPGKQHNHEKEQSRTNYHAMKMPTPIKTKTSHYPITSKTDTPARVLRAHTRKSEQNSKHPHAQENAPQLDKAKHAPFAPPRTTSQTSTKTPPIAPKKTRPKNTNQETRRHKHFPAHQRPRQSSTPARPLTIKQSRANQTPPR